MWLYAKKSPIRSISDVHTHDVCRTASEKTSSEPATIPGIVIGSVTVRNVVIGLAPRSEAASSRLVSCEAERNSSSSSNRNRTDRLGA